MERNQIIMNFIQRAQQFLRRRESFRTGMMKLYRLLDRRSAKESSNPLPDLTPQMARKLYENYRKGHYADVMLAWDALEEVDDTLGIIIEKRYAALKEMDNSVKINSEMVGDDPVLERLAQEQQDLLADYYGRITNLKEGIEVLASATFRGFGMVEPVREGKSIRLEPVDQWLMVRPVRGGAWYYNEHASSVCARPELVDESCLIIREKARPINIPVMFLIVAKAHTVEGWDGMIDIFGNPAIFFEMPPGTSDERAKEYDEIAQKMVGDGRGSYPSGGKIVPVETQARNGDIFQQRAKWIQDQIIKIGTGGLLTVQAESGSGTLAGNGHQETFRQLASGEGADLTECLNKQFSAPLLNRYFPGKPHLAYWSLEYADEEDTDKKVDRVTRLASAGYVADEQEVSELSGLTVKYQAPAGGMPSQLPMMNRMAAPALVTNTETTTEETTEPLLSPEELELLTALTKVMPKTERIEAEAKSLENALKNAIKDFAPDGSSEEAAPGASPLHVPGMGDEETDERTKNAKKGECRSKDPAHCRVHGTRISHEKVGQTGTAASLGLEKLKDIVPDPASSHSHENRAKRALTRGFTARSVDGQDIKFGQDIMTHWDETNPPKTESEKNRRLRRLSEAVRAVKSPHEIWEQHNGQKTYLRLYKDDNGKFIMSGFVTGKDGAVRSFFHSRRLAGAEKMRKGTLTYKRT